MELTNLQRSNLTAALDTLLPGDEWWPAAGVLGLADRVMELADLDPSHPGLVFEALSLLPADFRELEGEARTAAMERLETGRSAIFGVLQLLAYNAYYTDARVLDVVESRTGYEARPPQPLGYVLEPFDESLLEKVRARAPFWRRV